MEILLSLQGYQQSCTIFLFHFLAHNLRFPCLEPDKSPSEYRAGLLNPRPLQLHKPCRLLRVHAVQSELQFDSGCPDSSDEKQHDQHKNQVRECDTVHSKNALSS